MQTGTKHEGSSIDTQATRWRVADSRLASPSICITGYGVPLKFLVSSSCNLTYEKKKDGRHEVGGRFVALQPQKIRDRSSQATGGLELLYKKD